MAQDREYRAGRGEYQVTAWLVDFSSQYGTGILGVRISAPVHMNWQEMVESIFADLSIKKIGQVVVTPRATMAEMWLQDLPPDFLEYAGTNLIEDALEELLRLLVEIDGGEVCPIH